MAKSGLLSTSIARKVAMALSGLFLILFLTQHLFINSTSLFGPENFNAISHFMGHNPLVQYIIQPILIIGVLFHFIMGFVLDFKNRSSRPIGYSKYNGASNASWPSRNMIISGSVVLAFLALHFYDFWLPEMNVKYLNPDLNKINDASRYYPELKEHFESLLRTVLYCLAFGLLSLHLWHGFNSSFQSVGFNNKYSKGLYKFAKFYSVFVPFGFVVVALFHHFNQ